MEDNVFDIQLLKEKIRFYRRRSGLTQTELAEKLGVSFQAVSNWETGSTVPDLDNLCAISAFFGVSLDSLLRGETETGEQYLIGVDGGGTKSEFVLFASSGRVIKTLILPGTNASVVGLEEAVRILCQGIDMCLKENSAVSGIFIGNAGRLVELRSALTERYFQIPMRLDNDCVNALHCAEGEGALICGTGSILILREGAKLRTVGGWGYRLGDPGSAYNFGRAAFQSAMFYEDGIRRDATIYSLLMKKMGVSKIRGGYSGKSPSYIAAMAPLVFEAYQQGAPEAEAIIREEMQSLGEIINAGLPQGGRIVAGGGIMTHFHETLIPILKQYVNEKIRFVIPEVPMVYGACVAACREFGVEQGADFEENFRSSYRNATIAAQERSTI